MAVSPGPQWVTEDDTGRGMWQSKEENEPWRGGEMACHLKQSGWEWLICLFLLL